MFMKTVDQFAGVAEAKSRMLRFSPLSFLLSSAMAGAFIGLGIILIFSIGGQADPAYRPLVMGASFGIALILVVFAGADLFTGHTMTMTFGCLRRRTGPSELATVWLFCWLGNLAGAMALAALFVAGGGLPVGADAQFLFSVAAAKMAAPGAELFFRAILCNWCVCLAVWMSARMTGDAAKCIAIAWCLFTFIGSGYEHSVANMTLLSVALLADHPEGLTWAGMAHNLAWVTLGNIIGGVLFMGVGYWAISWQASERRPPVQVEMAATAGD